MAEIEQVSNIASRAVASMGPGNFEDQLSLLGLGEDERKGQTDNSISSDNILENALLFSAVVLRCPQGHVNAITPPAQYALLGLLNPESIGDAVSVGSKTGKDVAKDNRLFLNTNVPFSAFICGLQGSGKSHTMSCIIGIVLHSSQPCPAKLYYGEGGNGSRLPGG